MTFFNQSDLILHMQTELRIARVCCWPEVCLTPLCTSRDCGEADLFSQRRGSAQRLSPTSHPDRTAGPTSHSHDCQLAVPLVQSAGGQTAGSGPAAPDDLTGAPAQRSRRPNRVKWSPQLLKRHIIKIKASVTFKSKTAGFPGSCLAAFSTQNSALLWHSSWPTSNSAIFSTSSFWDAFNSTDRYIHINRRTHTIVSVYKILQINDLQNNLKKVIVCDCF